jgi:hypothetical protein
VGKRRTRCSVVARRPELIFGTPCMWWLCVVAVCGGCVWWLCVVAVCGVCVWWLCVVAVCGGCAWLLCVVAVCGGCVWCLAMSFVVLCECMDFAFVCDQRSSFTHFPVTTTCTFSDVRFEAKQRTCYYRTAQLRDFGRRVGCRIFVRI